MISYATDWDSLTKEFLGHLRFERNLSPNTIEAYEHDVRLLREFVEGNYDILPAEVRARHLEQFMAWVYDHGLEAASQARILSGVSGFFRFLQIAGVIEASPAEFLESPRTGRKLPDVLSLEEIDAVLAAIDLSHPQGHRNRAIIETLYSCGLRVSELVSLRMGDLFFDDGYIRVTGKGDKQRLVPLSGEARKQIGLWLEQRAGMTPQPGSAEIVFLNRNGKKLTRVMIFTMIRRAVEAAGIGKTVSPHTFRHSFATHLLEGGASIRQVQELLGHESILTTEIYTHLDRTRLARTLERIHPLGSGDSGVPPGNWD